jgi:hypothetical protein
MSRLPFYGPPEPTGNDATTGCTPRDWRPMQPKDKMRLRLKEFPATR